MVASDGDLPRTPSDEDSRRGTESPDSGLEGEREVVRRVETLLGILLDAMPHDALETRRDALVRDGKIRRFFPEDRRHRLGRRVAAERSLAREHLVEDGTEGKDVRPGVGGLAFHLLGRHVTERAHHDAGLRPGRSRRQVGHLSALFLMLQLGKAEIENLETAVLRHEQVLGLEVAVHDPFLVRRGQAVRDLQRVVDRFSLRQLPARERGAQRLAFEQLHDEDVPSRHLSSNE